MDDYTVELDDYIIDHPFEVPSADSVFQNVLHTAQRISEATGISETFIFDDGTYARYLQTIPDNVLQRSHRRKVMWVLSNWAGMSGAISVVGPTCGLSLLGVGVGVRMLFLQSRKGLLIEEELRERGYRIPEIALFSLFDSLKSKITHRVRN